MQPQAAFSLRPRELGPVGSAPAVSASIWPWPLGAFWAEALQSPRASPCHGRTTQQHKLEQPLPSNQKLICNPALLLLPRVARATSLSGPSLYLMAPPGEASIVQDSAMIPAAAKSMSHTYGYDRSAHQAKQKDQGKDRNEE